MLVLNESKYSMPWVRRTFGSVFVFFASLYLYIFVFCICTDTALRMLLYFSQPCQSASPPLGGSRNIHQQNAAMMMRTTSRPTMTTMMRTTRTTTKIEKPAFDCCYCAPNQCYCYFVGLSVDLVATTKFEWTMIINTFSWSVILQTLHSASFDFQNAYNS